MDRRTFILGAGTAAATGLAGCIGGEKKDTKTTTTTEKPSHPTGVYKPGHIDGMGMLGMKMDGRFRIMLSYAKPHEFYLVTGTRTNQSEVKDSHTAHLMASIWDKKTGQIAPGVEPSITIEKDGSQVASLSPWPMLSQRMGYHFGDNVSVDGDGKYTFKVSVNKATSRMPAGLQDVFSGGTYTFKDKEFGPSKVESLKSTQLSDSKPAGALDPMEMKMMPVHQQPKFGSLPDSFTGPKRTDDVDVAVGTLPASEFGANSETILAVSPQTRYNRYMLPYTSVKATVTRDGKNVFSGDLASSVHPEYGHFYSAGSSALKSGDKVTVEFQTPPQVSRHLGYEYAFLQMDSLTFTY